MEKKTNRKALLIGIIAAVVLLAALLALVLSQCTGGGSAPETTEPAQQAQEGYDLYWNVDRKEYDGKSDAGLSSRKPASDGFFHVRFFKDGEMLELKVADRKLINTIDTTDLMGLVFDENGIVVDVIRVDRMPVERVGWMFYVQSVGGNLIKLNSSRRLDGLEVLLEVEDYTAIYDMTGLEGEIGRKVAMPSELDRVIAIADLQGRVTHVFVTDRSEFMFSVEAECQHCKETVTWKEFTKTNEFPSMSGHYILKNDIKLKGSQVQLPEDCSICVDLNGKTISKTDGGRMIALFNPGCKLAIMDSSEDQSGTILVSGESTQGVGVWLRYGEFHFYGGTIDATAANTRSGGAAVALDANTFMYMHGGTIRGGNAKTEYNPDTDSYSRGMGGAMLVVGKFVMNGGLIEGGKAIPIAGYNAKGQPVNNRGYGGNILARGSATLELNGGVIRGGYAGTAGGNLYIDGTAELLLGGTQIQGGYVDGRGCNGGSVYIGSKATATMTGGSITGGYCYNEGANVYCSGTFNMRGGYIGGGTVYTYGTGKINEKCTSANFFLVNGTLNHYAGTIAGNVHAIDTSKTRACTVVLAGSPVIDGGKDCKTNLNLNTNGDGVKLVVTQLTDYARIGVNSLGIFSEKTDKANADNFFSDVGGEVIHYQERLAVGKLGCLCGSEEHYGKCDGTLQLFVPHIKESTLPVTEGYWYLTQDIQLTGQQNIRGQQNIVLDLNGHAVTTADGARAYALFDPELPITLTLTDSSKEKTGTIKAVGQDVQAEGQCVWIRTAGQTLELYDVTLDASEATNARNGAALYANAGTTINMYAGRITGGTAQAWYRETSKAVVNGMGGNVYTNGTFVMHGGIITGGKALSAQNADQVYTGGLGGNLALGPKAEALLLGGTISGGTAHTSGGNIYVSGSQAALLRGVAVSGGLSGNAERGLSGSGGNIAATGNLVLEAGSVTGGATNGNGGNIHLTAAASGAISGGTVSGGTAARGGNLSAFGKLGVYGGLISGGTADAGGNVFVYGAKAQAALHGGTLENGAASGLGGNLYVGADGANADLKDVILTGGKAAKGGNLAMAQKTTVSLATSLTGGAATDKGGNVYLSGGQLVLFSGSVEGGTAATGGNICLDGESSLTQKDGKISGGRATTNGGNLFVNGQASYRLEKGSVEKGIITRDGAANIDMRGTMSMTGGTVSGGVRVDEKGQTVTLSDSKINLFAYKSKLDLSGGQIDGGVLIHTAATALTLSGDISIASKEGKPSLTLNGALMTLGQLSKKAHVVISNSENTQLAASGSPQGIFSDRGLLVVTYADGSLWLSGHTHCASGCGGTNGTHEEGCKGGEEAWMLWDGGVIKESGKYCLHTTADNGVVKLAGQIAIGKDMEVSICLGGNTLSAPNRAFLVKEGGVLNITDCTGKGVIESKGINKDSGGVICLIDGTVNLYAGTLRKLEDKAVSVSGGGAIRVDAKGVLNIYGGTIQGCTVTGTGGAVRTAGTVNMYGGAVEGGTAQSGGAVYVGGGSFTMYGGTISGGKAASGGNVFVNGGSFTMAEDGSSNSVPLIHSGYATEKNGGNVFISVNNSFTMECGNVAKGYQSGGDGVGNIYVRGTLTVKGGDIFGGYRVEDDGVTVNTGSQPKANVFAVDGTLDISGGHIHGGVLAHNSKSASVVKLSKDAWIVAEEADKAALTLSNGALLTVDGKLSNAASVVISNGANTCISAGTERGQLSSDKGLVLSAEADGKLYLRSHTHCSAGCGQLDGSHADSCTGYDEAWTAWNGGNITASGKYCIHDTVNIQTPAQISAKDVTILVEGRLTSEKQALMIATGAEVKLTGSGTIEGKGVNGSSIGVVGVSGKLILDGVTLQQVADENITVSMGGVVRVTGGAVTMNSGTIQNGKATNGGNVEISSGSFTMKGGTIQNGKAVNGGNVFLTGGSFIMADGGSEAPLITKGEMTSSTSGQAGNVYVSAGATFTMECGSVTEGKMLKDSGGNFYVAGTLNISGGLVDGGYRDNGGSQIKANVFAVDATVNMSGGLVAGGMTIHNNKASSTLKVSKDAKIESLDSTKPSLTLSNGALLTVDGKLSNAASVVISNGANTCISAGTERGQLSSDKSLVLSAEADGKLYLRSHTHCSAACGGVDGFHWDSCTGYDEAWTVWDGSDITVSGKYCIHDTVNIQTPAQISAKDVTILVEGKLSSTKRALNIKSGAEVKLIGSGTVEGKGVNNENAGVVIADGKLTIESVILQQVADASVKIKNGGVLTVGSTGQVTMESGFIRGGSTVNGGGNVFVNGGSFTLNGGTIQDGVSGVGGNIFLYNGGSFIMADDGKDLTSPLIIGGYATGKNGGNVNISAGSQFTLEYGGVENGRSSGGDGVGNIYVGGTLNISGGVITGGYRVEDDGVTVNTGSQIKANVFAVDGTVNMSGGLVDGGMTIHNNKASSTLKVSKDAKIESLDGTKPSLTLSNGALLTVDGKLSDAASVVISNGANTCISAGTERGQLSSDKGLVLSAEADGKLYLRSHTHCSAACGGVDGFHWDSCTGYDEAWTVWDGGNITASGKYCIHDTVNIQTPAQISAKDVTILVEGRLTSEKQALMIASGAEVKLTGSGTIEGKGVNGSSIGVVGVSGQLILDGVTLQQVADENITVSMGGVIRVTGGAVTMNSGTIQNGKATNGGNVEISSGSFTMKGGTIQNGKAVNGGNVFLTGGSFIMADGGSEAPLITKGEMTSSTSGQAGNVYVSAGATFTMECGSVTEGKMLKDSGGNFYVAGTLNISGGTVSGGYRDNGGSQIKANVFAVDATVNMSGGLVAGGMTIHNSNASSIFKVSKDAKIENPDSTKPSLTLSNGALLTVDGALDSAASIVVSNGANTKLAASGSHAYKANITSDKGLLVSVEADGMYLRSHTHCSAGCGQLDGSHADSCTGYDEAWTAWDGSNITAAGNYCLHGDKTLTGPATISAQGVTLQVNATLTSEKQALMIASGAEVTLSGSGIIEGKGVNGSSIGVVGVSGQLILDGVTLQQVADENITVSMGGVIRVTGGAVTMNSGTIQNGKATNGGNVEISSGSFTMKGGTIQNGKAVNGGNVFLTGGSFVMVDGGSEAPLITKGEMTSSTSGQAGNVYVSAGATFTMECGSVTEGKMLKDSGGNFYVAGTLNISGGTVSGGYRDNGGSQIKANVFAVDATVNMSGGLVAGGMTIHNNKASSTLKVSKDAKIESLDSTKPSLTLSNGALLTVDGALDSAASIVVSNGANTKLAVSGSHAYKANITSDKGLLVSVEADGMYLRSHTHCSAGCGQLDGSHGANCSGYDVAGWTKWDGSDITAAGNYCLHTDKALTGPATISAQGVTLQVNATLSSEKQALVIATGAEVTLSGSGTIEGKGENAGNGGVVYVDGGKLTVQTLTLQQTADSAITVKNGGVLYVASGSVNLESGTVQSGKASYGGNIYVASGTVTQSGALVTGGSAAAQASEANKAQGGNICIASGATYTLKSGTVQSGNMAALDGAGNIDVRGTFVMEGGTVTGGYRASGGNIDLKNNIFAVNSTVQLTGGQIDGGVMIFSTAADRAQLQVGKDAKLLTNSAGKGLTLYQSKVIVDTASLTGNALVKLTGTDNKGNLITDVVIAQSKNGVTMPHSVKSLFGADAGGILTVGNASYKLSLEKDNQLYLRAGDAHVHCLCGRTDGTHAEGCGGWDVVFDPTTSFPTASGNYYLNAAQVKANGLQLGTSNGSSNVSINLCLCGKEVTNDSGTARIALIWGGSSLTVTDCGSGTIKANATTGNGGIFHPAKNSLLTVYNGKLDASTVSSAKPGVAIDNAGTTKIYGGQVLGGNATATTANGAGGSIRNTGTLLIAGGTISGGRSAYRGGNIYSENGSVTISGGKILNGWVCFDSSNIDVRNGSLTISGGTISGGNRYTNSSYTAVHAGGDGKRNIFTLNTTVVISGGQIDGGVNLHKTNGGSVTISGAPQIASAEAGKKNLTSAYQLVIGKPGLDKKAQIKITSVPAGALAVAESGLTLTSDMAACFVNDSGVAATLENNQILFK